MLGFVYAEAMDRIHRLGQHRPVQAIKLVVEDSIESRIVQVRLASSPSGFCGVCATRAYLYPLGL